MISQPIEAGLEGGQVLLDRFTQIARHLIEKMGQQALSLLDPSLPAPLSFNLVFNHEFMMIVPRRIDGVKIQHNNQELFMSFNSVGIVGYLLTKSELEFEALKNMGPLRLLEALTFPIND